MTRTGGSKANSVAILDTAALALDFLNDDLRTIHLAARRVPTGE